MSNATCVLFVAHRLDAEVVSGFARMRRECEALCDVVMLYDDTRGDFSPAALPAGAEHHLFSLTSIRSRYPLRDHAQPGRRRRSRHVGFTPGNHTFPVLEFQRRRPNYDFLWRVEYDVRFRGSWRSFFGSFDHDGSDLLATTLFRKSRRPEWRWWSSLRKPLLARRGVEPIRGFLPVCRLSRRACELLDRAFRSGWQGHDEVAVPTILASHGLSIEDIGGEGEFVRPGNENRFYTNTPGALYLAPGTFVCSPASCDPPTLENKLYHPVKAGRA